MTGTIYVVDDEPSVRRSTELLLSSMGYDVHLFASGPDFLGLDELVQPACALFDMRMPGMDGLRLLAEVRARGWTVPVILTSGHTDGSLGARAISAGVFDVVEKPYAEADLFGAIDRALASSMA